MDRHGQIRAMTLAALDTPPPPVQLLAPLDYILSDHFRQRALCQALERLSEISVPDHQMTDSVLRFLRTDFRLHIIDEEEDLFPLLRRRAAPEDDVGSVLESLAYEHATGRQEADLVVEALTRTTETGGKDLTAAHTGAFVRDFAARERRHLIVENAIVMPLAKSRLTVDDLRNLGRRMAARRGIDYPEHHSAD